MSDHFPLQKHYNKLVKEAEESVIVILFHASISSKNGPSLNVIVSERSLGCWSRSSSSCVSGVFSGGHTTEILRLMESLSAAYTPRHYVIADTDRMSEEKICTFESSKQHSDSESQVYNCLTK